MGTQLQGIGKKERAQLAQILRAGHPVITPSLTAKILGIKQTSAAQLLALWKKKGWLSRLKRGAYIPVSLQSDSAEVMADEPWVIAKHLYAPCYIGGWSAAEHWDFTEQIFNSVMTFTSKKVANSETNLHGAKFTIKTVKPERLFGTKIVWLKNQKVEVSDPTKTIVDVFNDPSVGGGIRMAIDFLNSYMKSEHKNLSLLLEYSKRMRNTAIFKRLGYVFEQKYSDEHEFIKKCRSSLKAGYSHLDPSAPGKRLVTNWKLWVPSGWKKGPLT